MCYRAFREVLSVEPLKDGHRGDRRVAIVEGWSLKRGWRRVNVGTVRQKNGRCRKLEVAVCEGSTARNGLKGLYVYATAIPPSTALYRAGERWAGPVSQPPRSLTRLCNSRSLPDPARTPVMDPKWSRELEGKWNWSNSRRNEAFLRNGFQMAWLNFGCRDLWVLLKTIVTRHSRFALASTARLGKRSAWGGSWGYFVTECIVRVTPIKCFVFHRPHNPFLEMKTEKAPKTARISLIQTTKAVWV